MDQLLGLAGSAFDLMLVVLGFGFIIFIHELGHFLAAKWAGIRVLAFAIGFGPAVASYRKGMGWRRGSSEKEYMERVNASASGAGTAEGARPTDQAISPTEYRLNWLPLGGYVKMLGQDDANPAAVSDAPDGYQRCKPWKRMVVISAGVVMNMILASVLFVAVFMHGLKTEPAKVGAVRPGSPASRAVALAGAVEPGLKTGDVIVSVNGRTPNSFNDLILATAMTSKGGTLRVVVRRPGEAHPIDFDVRPEIGDVSGLQEIGVLPSQTTQILPVRKESEKQEGRAILAKRDLAGVDPGMRLIEVGGRAIVNTEDALAVIQASDGKPVEAVFSDSNGTAARVLIKPQAELQSGRVAIDKNTYAVVEHLLGLTPVMKVMPSADPDDARQGLKDNDIFARVGSVEFPSIQSGKAEIKAHSGHKIEVSVWRLQGDQSRALVPLDPAPKVKGKGIIGFIAGDTEADDTIVALPPAKIIDARHPGDGAPPAATRLITRPGTRIVAVAGTPVANFTEIRAALRAETKAAFLSSAPNVTVPMTLLPPFADSKFSPETVDWTLTRDDLQSLFSLGWTSQLSPDLFETEQFILQAAGPVDALRMGLNETHRVMMSTYVTFARLFEGTVKVEHLKGPVGIAHMGTVIASRGMTWLLFFMALISVNLAVINFLPLPIVDGGQFLFLVIEQIRGKPVPLGVQNVATIAGLLLIGTMFIVVTFHDIANLFG